MGAMTWHPDMPQSRIELFCGDNLGIMPQMGTDSVDIVITDPPYVNLDGGIVLTKRCGGVADPVHNTETVGDLWGASLEWCKDAWRVARYAVLVFCGHKSVTPTRAAFPSARTVALLTWYKRNSCPVLRNVPKFTTEYIWLLEKASGLNYSALKTTCFDIPMLQAGCFATERILEGGTGKALHPAQKPVELMSELLAIEPDSVLDPFMGLGATGVACAYSGIDFAGIEIDPVYFEIAQKRICEARAIPPLFVPEPEQMEMALEEAQ